MLTPLRSPQDETRHRICSIAESLFRRLGYAKTTVADIAGALGMSSANVYRFFPSKSAINDAICRQILGELQEQVGTIAHGDGTSTERVRAMLLAMHRHHKGQFTDERRVFDMVSAAMEENWAAIEEHLRICGSHFADVVAQGIASGEFGQGDPIDLGEMVMKSCAFIIHPNLIAECGDKDMEPVVERLIAFALRSLTNANAGSVS